MRVLLQFVDVRETAHGTRKKDPDDIAVANTLYFYQHMLPSFAGRWWGVTTR